MIMKVILITFALIVVLFAGNAYAEDYSGAQGLVAKSDSYSGGLVDEAGSSVVTSGKPAGDAAPSYVPDKSSNPSRMTMNDGSVITPSDIREMDRMLFEL